MRCSSSVSGDIKQGQERYYHAPIANNTMPKISIPSAERRDKEEEEREGVFMISAFFSLSFLLICFLSVFHVKPNARRLANAHLYRFSILNRRTTLQRRSRRIRGVRITWDRWRRSTLNLLLKELFELLIVAKWSRAEYPHHIVSPQDLLGE